LRQQIVRFVVVGLGSAVVDFGLLVVLMAAGLGPTAAKAWSWVAGTLTAYLGNRRWTFTAAPSWRRLIAVLALYLMTFGVQVGLFHWLYPPLLAAWGQRWAQVVAFVIAQGVATVTNFVVLRQVVFRLTVNHQ
jgi:putative flippase GtrA